MSTNLPPFFDELMPEPESVQRPLLKPFELEQQATMLGAPHEYFLLCSTDGRVYSIPSAKRDFEPQVGQPPYFEALGDQLLDTTVEEGGYFQLTTDTAFLRERGGVWKLARLIHPGTSDPFLPGLTLGDFVREELAQMGSPGSERNRYTVDRGLVISSDLRRSIAAAPLYSDSVVRTQAWDKAQLFPDFPGELSLDAERRQNGLAAPEELLELLPHFPQLLRFEGARVFPSFLCFLSFVHQAGAEQLPSIQAALARIHPNELLRFIHLFQLCEWDWSIGEKLMSLVAHPKRDFIAFHFGKMLEARDAILMGDVEGYRWLVGERVRGADNYDLAQLLGRIDRVLFRQVMLKDMVAFVEEASNSPVDRRYGEFSLTSADAPLRMVQDHFPIELSVWGGLFKEATVGTSTFSKEDLETLLLDTKFTEFQGSIAVPKCDFSEEDLAQFKTFVTETYKNKDPELGAHLIEVFPEELRDPRYKFLTIKVRGRLVGIIKWSQDGDVSSFYVDPSYAQKYAVGAYLQEKAAASIPRGTPLRCTASVRNPAIERHINRYGGVATGMTPGNANGNCREFQIVQVRGEAYLSKNKAVFTEDVIRSAALGGGSFGSLDPEARCSVVLVDSSLEAGPAYISMLQSHFDKGEVLTCVFYDKEAGEPDLKHTYMVFEKKPI